MAGLAGSIGLVGMGMVDGMAALSVIAAFSMTGLVVIMSVAHSEPLSKGKQLNSSVMVNDGWFMVAHPYVVVRAIKISRKILLTAC
jgi:membrane protein CcdC involved in cytochrome C biogenesis